MEAASGQPAWCVLLEPHLDLQQLTSLHGKRVLLRADLNLPLTTSGAVADATRLDSILPSLDTLTAKGARVVLCSHLGRPDTSALEPNEFSLGPVAALLAARLPAGVFTGLVHDCVGEVAAAAVAALEPGQVCDWALIEKGCRGIVHSCTSRGSHTSCVMQQHDARNPSTLGTHTTGPLPPSSRCACWRTCASTLVKWRTASNSRSSWQLWQMCMSTMHLQCATDNKPV